MDDKYMNDKYKDLDMVVSEVGSDLDDPIVLARDGEGIEDAGSRFNKQVTAIYDTVDYLEKNWSGEAAKRFIEEMKKYRTDFESFGSVCMTVGRTIKSVGEDYQKLVETR